MTLSILGWMFIKQRSRWRFFRRRRLKFRNGFTDRQYHAWNQNRRNFVIGEKRDHKFCCELLGCVRFRCHKLSFPNWTARVGFSFFGQKPFCASIRAVAVSSRSHQTFGPHPSCLNLN